MSNSPRSNGENPQKKHKKSKMLHNIGLGAAMVAAGLGTLKLGEEVLNDDGRTQPELRERAEKTQAKTAEALRQGQAPSGQPSGSGTSGSSPTNSGAVNSTGNPPEGQDPASLAPADKRNPVNLQPEETLANTRPSNLVEEANTAELPETPRFVDILNALRNPQIKSSQVDELFRRMLEMNKQNPIPVRDVYEALTLASRLFAEEHFGINADPMVNVNTSEFRDLKNATSNLLEGLNFAEPSRWATLNGTITELGQTASRNAHDSIQQQLLTLTRDQIRQQREVALSTAMSALTVAANSGKAREEIEALKASARTALTNFQAVVDPNNQSKMGFIEMKREEIELY